MNLTVGEGEFIALVGPSGCGKSTLLNLMAGFIRPEAGSVSIGGEVRLNANSKGVLISQQGAGFPWLTVRENLSFGLQALDRSEQARIADHYAGIVGLQGFEHSYPHELSGGMLKRVELARALVVAPHPYPGHVRRFIPTSTQALQSRGAGIAHRNPQATRRRARRTANIADAPHPEGRELFPGAAGRTTDTARTTYACSGIPPCRRSQRRIHCGLLPGGSSVASIYWR